MAYVLDENNPPNPEWRSFKYLLQFAKMKGTNPQGEILPFTKPFETYVIFLLCSSAKV